MLKHSLFAATLVLGVSLASCGAQPGKTIVKYEKGKDLMMSDAPADGRYALYASTDATPKTTVTLNKGEELGFRNEGDHVVAVAGSKTFPVGKGMAGTYYWKYEK